MPFYQMTVQSVIYTSTLRLCESDKKEGLQFYLSKFGTLVWIMILRKGVFEISCAGPSLAS